MSDLRLPETVSEESEIIDNLMRLTDALQQTRDGAELCDRIRRGNAERRNLQAFIEQSFLFFLGNLLQKYIKNSRSDPETRVKIILVQQRLQSFLAGTRRRLSKPPGIRYGDHPVQPGNEHAFERYVISTIKSAGNAHKAGPVLKTGESGLSAEIPAPGNEVFRNEVFRLNLNARQQAIEKQLEMLEGRLSDAFAHNRDFTSQIATVRTALERAGNREEVLTLKNILIDAAGELIQGHRWLADSLKDAQQYLAGIKTNNTRLRNEVDNVQRRTLIDEYTGMVNRTGFIRRLNAEIGRAHREALPLTLALLDPDRFNDVEGMLDAGAHDAVVRSYAGKVLGRFRAYDLVARLDRGKFAVLFPNTDKGQALCALRKAQNRAAETYYTHRGRKRSLPTFSTGITYYMPGETPESLLARAGKALLRAQGVGRSRIELETPLPLNQSDAYRPSA